MSAPDNIACPLCKEDDPAKATCFFVTLSNDLWTVCEIHASYFRGTALELNPDEYDFEGFDDESDEDYKSSV